MLEEQVGRSSLNTSGDERAVYPDGHADRRNREVEEGGGGGKEWDDFLRHCHKDCRAHEGDPFSRFHGPLRLALQTDVLDILRWKAESTVMI